MRDNHSAAPTVFPSSLLAFSWKYMANRKFLMFFMLFVGISWCTIMVAKPYVLKLLIDYSITGTQAVNSIVTLSTLFVFLLASDIAITNLYLYVNAQNYPKIMAEIVRDAHEYLIQHSYAFFQNNFSGNLTRKIFDLSGNFETLVQVPVEKFFIGTLRLLFATILLLYSVPITFSLTIAIWSVIFVYVTYKLSSKSRDQSMITSEADHQVGGTLSDSITNIISIKLFSGINAEKKKLNDGLTKYIDAAIKLQLSTMKVNIIQGCFVVFLMASMFFLLTSNYMQGRITAGDFALVVMLSSSLVECIYMIGRQIVDYSKTIGTMRQALSILTEPHEVVDPPGARAISVSTGEIKFEKVCFAYDGESPIFSGLEIHIPSKQKIGLVSLSGGGKSTLVKLLLRLFDLQDGRILIDGQDISKITKASLRNNIAMIPQDPELFHRTLFENIKFARPSATNDEIVESAKLAQCDHFINELENGYDSVVGEKGIKLSGGQRQRIAIARAILKNSPILILDEATSALDSVTEKNIQDGLDIAMKNKTAIVIAHRLSTLKNMDRIIVLDKGSVVEDDSPDTLLEKDGIFSKLWNLQSDGFIGNLPSNE